MKDCFQFYYADSGEVLPMQLLNCGHERVTSVSYRWDGRKRGSEPMAIWQYTLAGRGAIVSDGRTHELEPGRAFLVTVPDDHIYFLPEDSPEWEFLFLTVCGEDLLRLTETLRGRYGGTPRHSAHSPLIRKTFELLGDCLNGKFPGRYRASALAYEFWMLLAEEMSARPEPEKRTGLADLSTEYLLKHPETRVDVADLAAALGYSRAHFTRLFHAETGESPGRFLLDVRLRIACRLLSTEQEAIKTIAWRTGFPDPSYFCRVFRQKYHMSPEAFRSGGGRQLHLRRPEHFPPASE